jgi:dihydroorotate dehydrogenase (fumarate)
MQTDLSATVAGVSFPFCAMNASGTAVTMAEVRALLGSGTGAIVLKTATAHPFVHPEFRSLHNEGFDKLLPVVREIVALGSQPIIASVAGATPEEYAQVGRAMAEAGAAMIEANVADPWVASTLGPFERLGALRDVLAPLVQACPVPVSVKLPERVPYPYAYLADELNAAGVRVVVIRNDFEGIDLFMDQAGEGFEVIVVGGIKSGYDVARALGKGAKAVQVGSALVEEGPRIFARLAREMRIARGERPEER